MVTTRPPKTIVKPTALGPVANTDTKLLIYGLFRKGRVLAQDAITSVGGRAPPGRKTPTPCEESRSPALAHGSLAQAPSAADARPSSARLASTHHAPLAAPTCVVFPPCSLSSTRPMRSLPTTFHLQLNLNPNKPPVHHQYPSAPEIKDLRTVHASANERISRLRSRS